MKLPCSKTISIAARSAFGKTVYSNEKIKKALDFKFRTLDEMVENAVEGRC